MRKPKAEDIVDHDHYFSSNASQSTKGGDTTKGRIDAVATKDGKGWLYDPFTNEWQQFKDYKTAQRNAQKLANSRYS